MPMHMPFQYGAGAGKGSLLGSLLTGEGAALATPRDTYPLILRKGAVAPVTVPTPLASALEAYTAHFTSFYDAPSVDRHVATVLRGGRRAYLEFLPGGLSLTSEAPGSQWPSHHAEVAAGLSSSRPSFASDVLGLGPVQEAFSNLALRATGAFCEGPLEVVHSLSGTNTQMGPPCGHLLASSRSGSVLGNAGFMLYPTQAGHQAINPTQANALVRSALKPGHVVICMRWHEDPSGFGTELNAPWKVVYFRRKLKTPSRTAMITISQSMSISQVTVASKLERRVQVVQDFYVDTWITVGAGATQKVALATGAEMSGAQFRGSNGAFSMDTRLSVVVGGSMAAPTAPSVGPMYGTHTDGTPHGLNAWHFPSTVTFNGNSVNAGQSVTLTGNEAGLASYLLAGLPPRDGLDAWSPITDGQLSVMACQTGRAVVALGADLTTNPYIQYRLTLSAIPTVEPLGPSMTPQVLGTGMRTKLAAVDLRAILQAVEDHSGDSTRDLRNSLTTDDRIFYGFVDDGIVAPPASLLQQISIYQTALEAGESILDRPLIEADPDDPTSVAVTFGQANQLAAKFRNHAITNGRRGIVVVGPTLTYTTVTGSPRVGLIDNELVFTDATYAVKLAPSELDDVYAQIRSGRSILYSGAAMDSRLFTGYVSPNPGGGYPPANDKLCLEVFGASYGSITKGEGANAVTAHTVWNSGGNISGGYLKPPAEWTPEFWLMVSATKGWKLETVLGTLLTNPYGVGSLTQTVLKAASHEAD